MDESTTPLTLEQALARADGKGWASPLFDRAAVETLWRRIASGEEAGPDLPLIAIARSWPDQWPGSGILDRHDEVLDLRMRVRETGFPQLLDKLIWDSIEDAYEERDEWLCLVPEQRHPDAGQIVTFHHQRRGRSARNISSAWWRPFVARLEERLGLPQTLGNPRQEGAFFRRFSQENPQLPGRPVEERLYAARVVIDRKALENEPYVVFHMRWARAGTPEARDLEAGLARLRGGAVDLAALETSHKAK